MSEGSWLFDGVSDEFFDDFVTCLDFPLEDFEKNGEEEDWNTQFQRLDEPCFDAFAFPEPGLCSKNTDDLALQAKRRTLPAPYNNISKRKHFNEATITHSGTTTLQHNDDTSDVKDVQMLQTYSPVSVFESSSSWSVENPTFDSIIPQRARSKRQRLSNCSRIFSVPFVSRLPFSGDSHKIPASGLAVKTYSGKLTNSVKKKRKKEMSLISGNMELRTHVGNDLAVSRKCMHCEVTKTPQWREGPMGPKTLCNACGVRYRSGRLFPEYRPSASPTFVASLHSNCHKKVIEMRSKASQKDGTGS